MELFAGTFLSGVVVPDRISFPSLMFTSSFGCSCNREEILRSRAFASGTNSAGTFKVRKVPFVSMNDHATCPFPSTLTPFDIPCSFIPIVAGSRFPTKSSRLKEMDTDAPESHTTGKYLSFPSTSFVLLVAVRAARMACVRLEMRPVGMELHAVVKAEATKRRVGLDVSSGLTGRFFRGGEGFR